MVNKQERAGTLATVQVAIDLDDGMKVNYSKLGAGLKKIVGLDAKED
jgi:hypothetical protein